MKSPICGSCFELGFSLPAAEDIVSLIMRKPSPRESHGKEPGKEEFDQPSFLDKVTPGWPVLWQVLTVRMVGDTSPPWRDFSTKTPF